MSKFIQNASIAHINVPSFRVASEEIGSAVQRAINDSSGKPSGEKGADTSQAEDVGDSPLHDNGRNALLGRFAPSDEDSDPSKGSSGMGDLLNVGNLTAARGEVVDPTRRDGSDPTHFGQDGANDGGGTKGEAAFEDYLNRPHGEDGTSSDSKSEVTADSEDASAKEDSLFGAGFWSGEGGVGAESSSRYRDSQGHTHTETVKGYEDGSIFVSDSSDGNTTTEHLKSGKDTKTYTDASGDAHFKSFVVEDGGALEIVDRDLTAMTTHSEHIDENGTTTVDYSAVTGLTTTTLPDGFSLTTDQSGNIVEATPPREDPPASSGAQGTWTPGLDIPDGGIHFTHAEMDALMAADKKINPGKYDKHSEISHSDDTGNSIDLSAGGGNVHSQANLLGDNLGQRDGVGDVGGRTGSPGNFDPGSTDTSLINDLDASQRAGHDPSKPSASPSAIDHEVSTSNGSGSGTGGTHDDGDFFGLANSPVPVGGYGPAHLLGETAPHLDGAQGSVPAHQLASHGIDIPVLAHDETFGFGLHDTGMQWPNIHAPDTIDLSASHLLANSAYMDTALSGQHDPLFIPPHLGHVELPPHETILPAIDLHLPQGVGDISFGHHH